ncbi:MAG: type III-A CRISPR-associated protein Csm2 [Methanobrevibacter sp.]|jgi:CRISPR-associated protein Csm2|nr:type III-A CRISPR-associated protein Csm2 [Candidatus Methanoflexus mossambicus]
MSYIGDVAKKIKTFTSFKDYSIEDFRRYSDKKENICDCEKIAIELLNDEIKSYVIQDFLEIMEDSTFKKGSKFIIGNKLFKEFNRNKKFKNLKKTQFKSLIDVSINKIDKYDDNIKDYENFRLFFETIGDFMSEIGKITIKIDKLGCFSDYDEEDFAKFGGDADIITQELNKDSIKISQLRKFFAAVKDIELKLKESNNNDNNCNNNDNNCNDGNNNSMQKEVWDSKAKAKFYLLMPNLAYARSRDLIKDDSFYKLLKTSMNKVINGNDDTIVDDFKKFALFLTSIVAFYKANNPKSN